MENYEKEYRPKVYTPDIGNWHLKDKAVERKLFHWKPADWRFIAGSVPVEDDSYKVGAGVLGIAGERLNKGLITIGSDGKFYNAKSDGKAYNTRDVSAPLKYQQRCSNCGEIIKVHEDIIKGAIENYETMKAVEDVQIGFKKRRFDMFGKKKNEELATKMDYITNEFEAAKERGKKWAKKLEGIDNELTDINQRIDVRIDTIINQTTDKLKVEIDMLKYPMGHVEVPFDFGRCYIYAGKKHLIPKLDYDENITGYRKQGDYIQIRREEEHRVTSYKEEIPTIVEHTKTFLLKDELIPLPDCTVDFLSEFIEVKGE